MSNDIESLIFVKKKRKYNFIDFAHTGSRINSPRGLYVGDVGSSNYRSRRPRSEKRPIPDEQKDDKYYERRKRNNQAAKKSRDARKIREDHVSIYFLINYFI